MVNMLTAHTFVEEQALYRWSGAFDPPVILK
jgi:hypothetical protein